MIRTRFENSAFEYLPEIKSPEDIRKLNFEQLGTLAEEIHQVIVDTVARTGGHLASNLGVIELTLALHFAFDTPRDKLIWDVGHQVYTHKIITGRCDALQKGLRQYQGIAGFPKKSESEYDHYDTGHSGTSISFALGMAEALDPDSDERVIAIIGDGSTTAGVAFEALNQSGQLENKNLIVVLNDNDMSISPNVGSLSQYISRRMVSPNAASVRRRVKSLLQSIPRAGDDLIRVVQKLERSLKDLIQSGLIFEELGFQYLGPFDGHDLSGLIGIFRNVKNLQGPLLLHVMTKKGYGYKFSELEPERFHGASPFEIKTGKFVKKSNSPPSYTSVFGKALIDLAKKDDRIVAITAAMTLGTGLEDFAREFPDRFYDVGIAEQHAITFAGGLANAGKRPVAAIYSTFLQRAYDQVFHDVCLQGLPVVFAIDRGGIVGADGPTHHGVFDHSYLRHLPKIVVMAPRDGNELRRALFSAVNYDRPVAIRYPRGAGSDVEIEDDPKPVELGSGEILRKGSHVTVVVAGPLVYEAVAAADALLDEGIEVEVIDARFVKPLDTRLILKSIEKTGSLVTIEENALAGGFGSAILEFMAGHDFNLDKVEMMGIPDRFVPMGTQQQLREELGLTQDEISRRIRLLVEHSTDSSLPDHSSSKAWHGLNPS